MKASNAQTGADGAMPLAAAPSPHAWAALAALCIALSVAFAALPVDIGYQLTSDAKSSYKPHVIADIGASKAYAEAVPVDGAVDLLKEYANVSGLPYGEFVAAVAAIVTSSTGMVTGVADGIMLESGLDTNLSNLVDAADYPDWSTLDAETQSQWGSQENYQAAKFNSLLNAFGFEETSSQYYGSFSSQGGGTFEPSEDVERKLQQIGRVGNRWAMGLGNSFSSIASFLTDREALNTFFGSQPGYGFNAYGIEDWPSNVPTYLEMGYGSTCVIETQTPVSHSLVYIGVWKSDRPVWMFIGRDPYNDDANNTPGYTFYNVWMFSEASFTYGSARSAYGGDEPSLSPTQQAQHYTDNGYDFYFGQYQEQQLSKFVRNSTFPINSMSRGANVTKAIGIILGHGGPSSNGAEPDLPGYPEGSPEPDDMVYYPSDGVGDTTVWQNFITPTEVIRPENPFNPDDQSSTDKWQDETEANVKGLQGIHFQKIFPFCLLWDVKLVFEKMKDMGALPQSGSDLETQGAVIDNSSVYMHVKLPLYGFDPSGKYIHEEEGIEYDLKPIYDLLIVVRPAFQVLLIVGLLYSLIQFWKGVLFG